MTRENTYDNRVLTRSSASWDCRYAEMQSLRQIRRRHRYLHYQYEPKTIREIGKL